MLTKIGEKFTDIFQRNMPDAYVFALILTLITAVLAFFWVEATAIQILQSWYDGFWTLLEFGMQMVLLIITGYSIALSPLVNKGIDRLTNFIKTPAQVYFFSIIIGILLSMVSYGWIVIAAVLARELALRVAGVNYPFLIACVYFSNNSWVTGLSSSIPLLLNTENNYMIEAGILTSTIPTSYTLGSILNIAMIVLYVVVTPLLMLLLIPKKGKVKELGHMLSSKNKEEEQTIAQEAADLKLPKKVLSDRLNNSMLLQLIVAILGLSYIIYHFGTKGFSLNLNIMIFIFLVLGLILHKTPIRYSISMKRASVNVSGILFQFPFYAGIMGIMTYTGLGEELALLIASVATIDTYPFFAYLLGGIVNFAIPSGGGEFAVIGPSVIEAVQNIATGATAEEMTAITSRASLSIAYGESLTNLLQPFYLLLVLPVMGAGIKIQARDVMGYLVVPFILYFILQSLMVIFVPL
ncbi:MAG: TIGR00366 family protein [Maribacter sp.]|uniref:short-chain fatty acid transporter n=1 Tax=Maribacter sp. TaxID=1897614 RepID=UPI00329812F7